MMRVLGYALAFVLAMTAALDDVRTHGKMIIPNDTVIQANITVPVEVSIIHTTPAETEPPTETTLVAVIVNGTTTAATEETPATQVVEASTTVGPKDVDHVTVTGAGGSVLRSGNEHHDGTNAAAPSARSWLPYTLVVFASTLLVRWI